MPGPCQGLPRPARPGLRGGPGTGGPARGGAGLGVLHRQTPANGRSAGGIRARGRGPRHPGECRRPSFAPAFAAHGPCGRTSPARSSQGFGPNQFCLGPRLFRTAVRSAPAWHCAGRRSRGGPRRAAPRDHGGRAGGSARGQTLRWRSRWRGRGGQPGGRARRGRGLLQGDELWGVGVTGITTGEATVPEVCTIRDIKKKQRAVATPPFGCSGAALAPPPRRDLPTSAPSRGRGGGGGCCRGGRGRRRRRRGARRGAWARGRAWAGGATAGPGGRGSSARRR